MQLVRCCATFALAIVSVLFAGSENPCAAQSRPNVLFIAVDDLNDWVGCLARHPDALTPNIDRLASRGMLFANAHCQAPICGPSRASVFSGLLPTTTGIYGQISDKNLRQASPIMRDARWLPDYLESFGYETLAAGKLFHNGDRAKVFDDWAGHNCFGPKPEERFRYDPADFPEKIGGTQTDWGAFPERDEQMPDYQIAAYGVEQLGRKHDAPFFLAVGFMRPHVPWYVPRKWFDLHPLESVQTPLFLGSDFEDIPEISRRVNELTAMPTTRWAIENQEWNRIVQAYLACTTFVDAQIGKVLDALETSQYAENTIVILWSDHGYHIGEKDRFAKQALWDRATRVPLIVSVPEQLVGVCHQPVGLIDLYPTVVELCGLPANEQVEGHSLAPLLGNPDQDWPYVTPTAYGPGNHAVQSERFRYYRYADGAEELYDHRLDPNEWHNLASAPAMQAVKRNMAKAIPSEPAGTASHVSYPTNEYFLNLRD